MSSIARELADIGDPRAIVEASWVRFSKDGTLWLVYKDYSVLMIRHDKVSSGEIPPDDFLDFLVAAVNALGGAELTLPS